MSIQKMRSRGGESSRPVVPESAGEEVVDRLAGLLPEDALQDALEGLLTCSPAVLTGQAAGIRWSCSSFQVAATSRGVR
jgi:hypothetical protein